MKGSTKNPLDHYKRSHYDHWFTHCVEQKLVEQGMSPMEIDVEKRKRDPVATKAGRSGSTSSLEMFFTVSALYFVMYLQLTLHFSVFSLGLQLPLLDVYAGFFFGGWWQICCLSFMSSPRTSRTSSLSSLAFATSPLTQPFVPTS